MDFLIADDHTRVRLRSLPNKTNLLNNGTQTTMTRKPGGSESTNGATTNGGTGGIVTSDLRDEYLNANFIDGFRRPKAYIGTQGPMQGSFPEFWRMIWEQNTTVIVMITHLFEGGKVNFLITIFCLIGYIFFKAKTFVTDSVFIH